MRTEDTQKRCIVLPIDMLMKVEYSRLFDAVSRFNLATGNSSSYGLSYMAAAARYNFQYSFGFCCGMSMLEKYQLGIASQETFLRWLSSVMAIDERTVAPLYAARGAWESMASDNKANVQDLLVFLSNNLNIDVVLVGNCSNLHYEKFSALCADDERNPEPNFKRIKMALSYMSQSFDVADQVIPHIMKGGISNYSVIYSFAKDFSAYDFFMAAKNLETKPEFIQMYLRDGESLGEVLRNIA